MINGISFDGSPAKPVVLKCFICDAPAKALIKGTIQYNGRYGCDFCEVRGEFDGRMLFLYKGKGRTDKSFREQSNPEHHKSFSPLLELEIDMIKQFPIDAMHCIDLGVTKRLIMLWKEGPLAHRLSAGQIKLLGDYHCSLKPFLPSEFNRKPRSLEELKLWKATEFRTFLMYSGPVILKGILTKEKYNNFMCLSIAVCMLYNAKLVAKYRSYAHELLSCFVEQARIIYSDKFVAYNVHCLYHMADIAEIYGCLENCVAYPFENNMSKIKRYVRGTAKPIVQVARRFMEMNRINRSTAEGSSLKSKRREIPLKGSCYRMNNGKFCIVHEGRKAKNQILCELYKKTDSLYNSPCDSRIIGVYKVSRSNTEMQLCNVQDLHSTVINIPQVLFDKDQTNTAIIIPMMHSK